MCNIMTVMNSHIYKLFVTRCRIYRMILNCAWIKYRKVGVCRNII